MFNRYVIKNGDSLEKIANQLGLDLNRLKEINQLYYNEPLRVGSEIILPESDSYFNTYVIEKGDTIYGIARKYNLNPQLLATLNGLKNEDYIYPGNEILIPKNNYSYYLTAEGDTLDMVSNIFKKPKSQIITENKTIYLLPEQLLVSRKSI